MTERRLLAMSDAEMAELLRDERRAHVGTIGADGTPHVVPLSDAVFDGLVTSWTAPGARKVANLRRDPRSTWPVEAGEHVARFGAVQLNGQAEVGGDAATTERVGRALFERASGHLTEELRAAVAALVPERVAITVQPERAVPCDHRELARLGPSQIGR